MTERREGHFSARAKSSPQTSGVDLFYQTWSTPGSRATLVLTHGMGESSESYWRVAEDFARIGYDTIAWDLRGHGRSEGKRGHIDRFEDFSHDLAQFIRYLKASDYLKRPYFLLGHSMGGLVTLKYIESDEFQANEAPIAVALSSPLLGVAMAVPALKDAAAQLVRKVWPSLTLDNGIRDEDLTRDPEWLKTYPKDTLRHNRVSPALYFGIQESIEQVTAGASRITVPILVQAAGHDKIVSTAATQAFFAQIASDSKEMIVYDESYHEILNDLDRDEVLKDLDVFLKNQLSKSETSK